MSRATLSILGLYQAQPNLFEGLTLPEGIVKDDLVNNLLAELAELECIYPNPAFMKTMIAIWSRKELPIWNRIARAAAANYNPIENYNRYETYTDVNNGDKKSSGNQSVSESGTHKEISNNLSQSDNNNLNTVAGFNSETMVNSTGNSGSANSATETETTNNIDNGSETDTTVREQSNNVVQHDAHLHGNIGVVSSQDMLRQEIEIAPLLDVDDYIINSFKNRFCLLVY